MYTAQLDRMEGKDNMQFTSVVRRQRSTDGGRTWGTYDVVFPEEGTFWPPAHPNPLQRTLDFR